MYEYTRSTYFPDLHYLLVRKIVQNCSQIIDFALQSSVGRKGILLAFNSKHSSFSHSMAEMAMLASKDFTAAKKLPPAGLNLMITGSRV